MMTSRLRAEHVTLAIVTVAATGLLAAAVVTGEPALLEQIGFSGHDIERIGRGEIVARTIEADGSTVAIAVAATIAVPPAFYIEKFRDIQAFKKTEVVQQVGRFAREPAASDMTRLTLDQSDIDDLRGCRIGDCGVKLDAAGIQAVAGRDARVEPASAALREHLAAYTRRYLQSGNSALMEYRDSSSPRRVADQLQVIGKRMTILRRWPTLFDAVFAFDGTLPPHLEDFVYWSKEKVGPRTVVSITHVVISPPRDGAAVIATKQIYASHYGDASLGVTLLFDEGTPGTPRMRIVYLNRSRVDVFGGVLGPIKRPLVRSRARDGAERMMRGLKERLETQYAAR